MAGRTNKDVQLVIRARDEAQRTIDAVSGALAKLLGIQDGVADSSRDVASGMTQIAAVAGTLDKAYRAIDAAADRASAAFERQAASIRDSKAELAALQGQAAGAARAIQKIQTDIVSTRLGGGDTGALVAQLRAAQTELGKLGQRETQLSGQIASAEAALEGQRSSMQRLGSFANAAADGIDQAAAATRRQTQALKDQAQAAALVQRIKDTTGVSRISQADGSAERSAELLIPAYEKQLKDSAAAERQFRAELQATGTALKDRINSLTGVDRVSVRAENSAETLFAAHEKQVKAAAASERQFRAEVEATGSALKDRVNAITGVNRVSLRAESSASVFQAEDARLAREAADAEIELVNAAARLRAATDPLGAIQARLNTELAEAQRLYRNGAISAAELARAERVLTASANEATEALNRQGRGDKAKPSLFGLKPYELTNLGYQINDVFTQLASGTGILQVLAQQGGQILQLMPQIGSKIIAAFGNPVILAAVAAFVAIGLAIAKAAREADRLRDFEGALAASAEGAEYQAKALSDAAAQLDKYGASAEAATKSIKTLVAEGINPALINDFAKAAQDLADILGIEVSDGAKQLAQGLSGGYDAVKKLDDATNLFTNTEMEMIRALFEEGRAQEARTRAADIAFRRLDEGARQQRGPWTDAIRTLGGAWQDFTSWLADTTAIQSALWLLEKLADGAKTLGEELNGVSGKSAILNEVMKIESRIQRARAATSPDPFGQRAADIAAMEKEVTRLRASYDALVKAEQQGAKDTVTADAAAREQADRLADISAKKREEALDKLDGKRRVAEAGQLAFEAEMRKSGNAVIANAERELAVQKEQAKVDKERAAAAKERARTEEAAIKGFSRKVIGPESSGDANATNGRSSAVGLGQFLESTWLNLFRKNFPNEAARMGQDAILALRRDATVSKKMIEIYARENAEVLKKASQSVTEANLYLTHFLGAQGALKILKAAPQTPVDQLLSRDVMSANPEYLRTDGGKGRARTASELRKFIGAKIGDSSAAEGELAARLVELADQRLQKQEQFSADITRENAERALGTKSLQQQQGLIGEALIQRERQQAIDEEILKKQQELDKINEKLVASGQDKIEMTDAERAAITKTVGAYFDLSRAKDIAAARRNAVDQPVQDLTEQRDAIQEQIRFLIETGKSGLADSLQPQLDAINARLRDAIDKARAFWVALAGDPVAMANLGLTAQQIQNIIVKLDTAKLGAQDLGRVFGIARTQIADMLSNGITNAFGNFIDMVAQGKNVFKSLLTAFGQFAADFLRQIAQMILKQLIFNAISSAMGTPGGIFHSGGIVGGGASNRTRIVNPAVFANAMRFHGGGVIGLRPDEQPAILQRGEEVLTRGDPRHRFNGGLGGGPAAPAANIKQVLVMDPNQIPAAMQSSAGDDVILTFITNNRETVRQELGIG